MSEALTQDRLKGLLKYDPDSGQFTWLVSRGKAVAGSEAGTFTHEGYRQIRMDGTCYRAHRLAFLYMTGEFPPEAIDHIDGQRANNRWKNLRAVSIAENQRNQRRRKVSESGFNGVSWDSGRSRWRAAIEVGGRNKHLGRFEHKDDAILARMEADLKYGFHENHGSEPCLT
jgi:hypothetical protein